MDSLANQSIIQDLTQFALANSYQIVGNNHLAIDSAVTSDNIEYDVSILIATYNHSTFIQKAVNQLLSSWKIALIFRYWLLMMDLPVPTK